MELLILSLSECGLWRHLKHHKTKECKKSPDSDFGVNDLQFYKIPLSAKLIAVVPATTK